MIDGEQGAGRENTDESLRVEREKADAGLEEHIAALEDTADEVLSRARERADRVIFAARAATDRLHAPDSSARAALSKERSHEDEAVRVDRACADAVVRGERKERIASLSVERDDTDRDLSSERAGADAALARRDEFLAIVSHDLRGLLSTMIGSAALISSERGASPGAIEHARRIERCGGRMNRLIGDLIDVASIEAGMLRVTTEVADPGAVVLEAVETFQAQARAGGVSLSLSPASTSATAVFDPARVLQVLVNLLTNALKFTPPSGHIVVRTEARDADIRITVEDTGVGIAPVNLAMVFGRFSQVTSDRRGLGLGLYISKCIVEGHGGEIAAESRLGAGSTFSFTLPR